MNEPLLPCPICGGIAEYKQILKGDKIRVHHAQIGCSPCGIFLGCNDAKAEDPKKYAYALWNTRTPPPPSVKWPDMKPTPIKLFPTRKELMEHGEIYGWNLAIIACKEINAPKGEAKDINKIKIGGYCPICFNASCICKKSSPIVDKNPHVSGSGDKEHQPHCVGALVKDTKHCTCDEQPSEKKEYKDIPVTERICGCLVKINEPICFIHCKENNKSEVSKLHDEILKWMDSGMVDLLSTYLINAGWSKKEGKE